MIQPVLPFHECANPAAVVCVAVESVAKPLHSIAEFAAEPPQSVVDSTIASATLTETSSLYNLII
jgi:hypothetical protein